jgi:hypothetical protein
MPTTMLLGATYFSEELTVKDFRLVEIERELVLPLELSPRHSLGLNRWR